MNNRDPRSEWTVIIGVGLMVLGGWLLLERFAGWAIAPIVAVLAVLARIGWPLLLIGIGILLVLRARGGGWAPSGRPLYRARNERVVAGVLGGVANWLGVNPTPLRVIYGFLTLTTGLGAGFIAYVIAALVIPEEPVGYVAPAPRGYAPPNAPYGAPYAPPAPTPPSRPAPTPPAPPAPAAPADPAAPPVPPVPPAPPAPPA